MSVFHNNVLAGAAGQAGGAAAAADVATRSLRFNKPDSAHLNRTPSSAGNRRTWTISVWCKKTANGLSMPLIQANNSANPYLNLVFTTADKIRWLDGGARGQCLTDAVFRDNSAWYHIVCATDTTLSTATDRVKIYVNGVRQDVTFPTAVTSNLQTEVNNTTEHRIGRWRSNVNNYLNGYLADYYLIDGSALAPTDFGAFDDNGVWQAAEYSGTFGTNGFHLKFADASSDAALGTDSSGNDNDWTVNNISSSAGVGNDVLFDVPTNGDSSNDTGAGGEVSGCYATLNPIAKHNYTSPTISNGNLDVSFTSNKMVSATIAVSSGKWYYEEHITSTPSATGSTLVRAFENFTTNNTAFSWRANGGTQGLTGSPTLSTYTNGDVLGIAVDVDNTQVTFYKNGTQQGTGAYTYSTFGSNFLLFGAYSAGTATISFNFGQRAFAHSAPSGYKALCTTNLPTPTIADGSNYFNTKLWTGTQSSLAITGLGFNPDLVWGKRYSTTGDHLLIDSVRGVNKYVRANKNNAEVTNADIITSFDSDGFTVGPSTGLNLTSASVVGFAWDAGSSTVSNTDGDITSSCRTSTASGFSIVSWTGNGSSNQTVGHNLGVVPELIIAKNRSTTNSWAVWTTGFNANEYLVLNSDGAKASFSGQWGSTPTSSVIGVNDSSVNGSGNGIIAYCFSSVSSYSQIGTYEGNGTDYDGPFVYLGFRPSWVMIKNIDSSTTRWMIYDSVRETSNEITDRLRADRSEAEYSDSYNRIDFLSNGFKIYGLAGTDTNKSGDTLLYLAFAENPFQANGGLAR
jgi:hypothetical protein